MEPVRSIFIIYPVWTRQKSQTQISSHERLYFLLPSTLLATFRPEYQIKK